MSKKPIAVVFSDDHYTLKTLELADAAYRAAIDKAKELRVPVIDCGDITNDKAVLRGEIVNRLLETETYADGQGVRTYHVVGNHSLINEKGTDHVLHFLNSYNSIVIQSPATAHGFNFIPYQTSANAFLEALKQFPEGSIVFAHQGTLGGFLGDYVKDGSAFDPRLTRQWRIFLGHYHKHYELENTVSIGNPYTLTFGEAGDGPKGFLIVYSDGSYEQVPLNYRRHVKIQRTADTALDPIEGLKPNDLLWLQVSGSHDTLEKLNKKTLGIKHLGHSNFNLDPQYSEVVYNKEASESRSDVEMLDAIIDGVSASESLKQEMKAAWRELVKNIADPVSRSNVDPIIGVSCHAENFCSYPSVEIDFSNSGLTLISGHHGSGKSNLFDLLPWILFGQTSKDGNADEVQPWSGASPTMGTAHITTSSGSVKVTRIRGTAKENDLYWSEGESFDKVRGKDIKETQKLLEQCLGVTADLYFTSFYLHQFSDAGNFFIAKPTQKRDVFEKLVDQTLAIKLAECVSRQRKYENSQLEEKNLELSNSNGKLHSCKLSLQIFENSFDKWQLAKIKEIDDLKFKSDNFESEKAKKFEDALSFLEQLDRSIKDPKEFQLIEEQISKQLRLIQTAHVKLNDLLPDISILRASKALTEKELLRLESLDSKPTCPTCLGPTDNCNKQDQVSKLHTTLTITDKKLDELLKEQERIQLMLKPEEKLSADHRKLLLDKSENEKRIAKFESDRLRLSTIQNAENHYLEQIQKASDEVNPHGDQVYEMKRTIEHTSNLVRDITRDIDSLKNRLSILNMLYDLSFELRGAMLSRIIKEIESTTNKHLENYFDSEVKIVFALESADKLETVVYKNGNQCTFKQLSGGQRCMLKLCFIRSVMKVAANKASVQLPFVFLDEAFNGLEDETRVKAFGFLQDMTNEYDSVFVVDHSQALKSLFDNVYHVELTGDESELSHV